MKPPVLGANVLYYATAANACSARITRVNADHSVSLIVFPDDPTIGTTQGRQSVPYAPGVAGGWGWNDAVEIDAAFVYTQQIAASVWTISHSRGRYQQVTCFDLNGNRVEPDESQPNIDQVVLSFLPPLAGTAILR